VSSKRGEGEVPLLYVREKEKVTASANPPWRKGEENWSVNRGKEGRMEFRISRVAQWVRVPGGRKKGSLHLLL